MADTSPTGLVILGYSDIVRRKVIPALASVAGLANLGIAGTRLDASEAAQVERTFGVTVTYGQCAVRDLLDRVDPPAVAYVSGANALHAERIVAALDHGLNVVVDKPAWLSSDDTLAIDDLARSRDLLVDEATVWLHSSLVQWWLTQLRKCDGSDYTSRMRFTIPHLDAGNFRLNGGPGSGPIWDLGPYFVSQLQALASVAANGAPEETVHDFEVEAARWLPDGSAEVTARGPGVRSVGTVGFGLPYSNLLDVRSGGVSASLEPAFTEPDSRQQFATVAYGAEERSRLAESRDSFRNFLSDFALRATERRNVGIEVGLAGRIRLLEQIRQSLEG